MGMGMGIEKSTQPGYGDGNRQAFQSDELILGCRVEGLKNIVSVCLFYEYKKLFKLIFTKPI